MPFCRFCGSSEARIDCPEMRDRRARHLLGDQHGLTHIVGAAAPAEAAAQQLLVDLAFADRQTARLGGSGKGRLAVLRARPDLALVGRVECRGVHRLHGGVVQVGEAVGRLDLLGRTVDRGLGVAHLVADERLRSIEALLQHGGDCVARYRAVLADVPFDGKGGDRRAGVPVGVCHDHDSIAVDRQDLLHARHLLDLGGVEALELAAVHRAGLHGRVQHVGKDNVGTVELLAGDLVDRVEALQRLAGDRPVLGIF